MSAKPEHEIPDWPPKGSATGVADGTFRRGSTGQLFVANGGQWVRVRKPAPVTNGER